MTRTGQPVYIGDLAQVQRMYKDPRHARSRSERAITAFRRGAGRQQRQSDFGNELRTSLDSLRPLLPPDLKIDMVADQPKVGSSARERLRRREFGDRHRL